MTKRKHSKTHQKGENRVVFAWKAPEYLHHEKSKKWYAICGVTAAICSLLAAITDNITFAIAIVAFSLVYYYIDTHHPPKIVDIVISEMGVRIDDKIYHYSQIKAFWIHYEHGARSLNLRIKSGLLFDVMIQLEEMDPVLIRRYLLTEVAEWEGKEEKLVDKTLRLLKF